jgi:PKD repeat protein
MIAPVTHRRLSHRTAMLRALLVLSCLLAARLTASTASNCGPVPTASFIGGFRQCAGTNAVPVFVCPGAGGWRLSRYTFDYGDGTPPVTRDLTSQSPPYESLDQCYGFFHTYASPGNYTTTVSNILVACPTDSPVTPVAPPNPTFSATEAVRTAPDAPSSPVVQPAGNPNGPVTGTDFLTVTWSPPASASGVPVADYQYRINGDPYTAVSGTSATASPRGTNDPITLTVRGRCDTLAVGSEASSPVYSPAPPGANFTFSSGAANQPIEFTDTSSPQATSWLWLFDDGGNSTTQSPSHTFAQGGTHNVALIATNGSGSTLKIQAVQVGGASVTIGADSLSRFEVFEPDRRRLSDVVISGPGRSWLQITSSDSKETIVYLRFLDAEGRAVLERRLSVAAGEQAVNDLGAYGLEGTFTLELVSGQRFNASLADSAPCRNPKEDCDEQP